MYIGSADLMPRNLYNRVELVTPIQDARIRAQMLDVARALASPTTPTPGSSVRTATGAAATRTVSRTTSSAS